jgi:hypothetical protein
MLRQLKINELTQKINKYKQDLATGLVKSYVEKLTKHTFPEWDRYVKSSDALYKEADVPFTHNEVTYTYDILLQLEKRYMYIHRHINTYNKDYNEVRICVSESLSVELSEIEDIFYNKCSYISSTFKDDLFSIDKRYDSKKLLDRLQGNGLSALEKKIIYGICAYGHRIKDVDAYFAQPEVDEKEEPVTESEPESEEEEESETEEDSELE